MGTAQRVTRSDPTPKAQRASLMALPQRPGLSQLRMLSWGGHRDASPESNTQTRELPMASWTNGDSESLSRAYRGLCLSVCELSSQWPQQLCAWPGLRRGPGCGFPPVLRTADRRLRSDPTVKQTALSAHRHGSSKALCVSALRPAPVASAPYHREGHQTSRDW